MSADDIVYYMLLTAIIADVAVTTGFGVRVFVRWWRDRA